MIEMSAADGAQSPQQQSMLWIFRGLALAIGPLTMSIPQSVFVYWTTNNAVSIVQSIVLRQDAVRKFLDIPKPPPPGTVNFLSYACSNTLSFTLCAVSPLSTNAIYNIPPLHHYRHQTLCPHHRAVHINQQSIQHQYHHHHHLRHLLV